MRKLTPACCAGLCSLASVFATLSPGQVQKGGDGVETTLAAAEAHYTQQQYTQAESELRGLLLEVPRNYSANELLGLVLTGEARDADATPFFENAVRTSPGSVPARENLAANYAKQNKHGLAESQFRILVRLDPKNFDLQHNCGEFYINRGKIADAIVPLKAAQQLRPYDYANGYDLALAEMMSGRLPEAEAQLKSLLALKEKSELHSMLAEVYEKQSKFLPAASEYQRAAQMDPTEDSIFDWGAELLRHKNLQEAAQVFDSGVHLYPQSWRLNSGLGLAWHMLGNDRDAVAPLVHAVDLNAADPRSYSFLSTLGRVPAEQSSQVTARFERYAVDNPESAEAQLYYATNLWQTDEVLNETSHSEKVEELLKRAIALNSRLPEAHMRLGVLYARRQDYLHAAAEFKQTIKLDPGLADAHYRLAQAEARLGQKKESAQEMEIFRKLDSARKEEDTVVAFLLTRQDKPK
ncbi:MAG: tetratricopeptide repeat protein [Acidobacteriaceae bacterium]